VVLALKLLFQNIHVVVNQSIKPQQQRLLKEEAAGLVERGFSEVDGTSSGTST
jgi:hypothetical protein